MNDPQQLDGLLRKAEPGAVAYLIGAGGCGMSGLGHLLLDLGFRVEGSDLAASEEVKQLEARGARIHQAHRAAHVLEAKPFLVVYSSAIRRNNPELQAAEQMHVPIARRA